MELAQGWARKPLGEVVTFQRGFDLPHRLRSSGSVPLVSSAGVTDFHSSSMVQSPGIVTGRYGTIGEVFFLKEPFWPLNTTLFVRDFHGNEPQFVFYMLHRFDFKTFSGKSGVPGVNRNELHRESVSFPSSTTEQRAIAEALSDVDGLLGGLDRLIAKKRDLKQASMQQLLTGQTRLSGFTGEWKVKQLSEDIILLSGHHVLAQNCNTNSEGVPYLTGPADFPQGRITSAKFTNRPSTICAPNDILVTVKGSGSGAIVLADSEYCISRQLMAIRVRSGNYRFIYYSLLQNADQFRAASTGLIPGLSRSDILDQPLPLPPTLDEQTAIADVLTDLDRELVALEQRREKTRALKQAMMQELLTGRTRLVPAGGSHA